MARRYTIGLNIIHGDLLGISKGKDSGGYLITLLLLKASIFSDLWTSCRGLLSFEFDRIGIYC